MKRKLSTIHYCSACRMTTPHAVAGNTLTCNRCGMVKTSDRIKSRHKGMAHSEHEVEMGCSWN